MTRERGAYILVHDPDHLFRPWVSSFPRHEVEAGLRLRTWRPGTVFWHRSSGRYWRVSEAYTLDELHEWDAALAGYGG